MRLLRFSMMLFCMMSINLAMGQYGKGLSFDPDMAKKHPKAPDDAFGFGETLPANFSLKDYTPYPKNQGDYGTCVGWATTYGSFTTSLARQLGVTDKNKITGMAFCPFFVYAQIHPNGTSNCSAGSGVGDGLQVLKNVGAKKFYTPIYSCDYPIDDKAIAEAKYYKIKSYGYIIATHSDFVEGNTLKETVQNFYSNKPNSDLTGIKKSISEGLAVPFGMHLPHSFNKTDGELWIPTSDEFSNPADYVVSVDDEGNESLSGHAMTIIGYDDSKYGGEGAFEIMNSWGQNWGNKGYVWIRYKDFNRFLTHAYRIELWAPYINLPGCMLGDCQEGFGRKNFTNGDNYEGEFKNGKYDGFGVYTWASGEVYAGQWSADKRQGNATWYLPGGEFGSATFLNDIHSSGFKEIKYSNGDYYVGNTLLGSLDGFGTYKFANGQIYSGSFKYGKRNGLGKYKWPDGSTYVGEWKDDKRTGFGVYVNSFGAIKGGKWENDVCTNPKTTIGFGEGEEEFDTDKNIIAESKYFIPSNCATGDCVNGYGEVTYPGGTTYDGTFRDGVRDGYGTIKWANGNSYTGPWAQHSEHGVGMYKFPTHSVIVELDRGTPIGYSISFNSLGGFAIDYFDNGKINNAMNQVKMEVQINPVSEFSKETSVEKPIQSNQ